jgi:hypothetical protein
MHIFIGTSLVDWRRGRRRFIRGMKTDGGGRIGVGIGLIYSDALFNKGIKGDVFADARRILMTVGGRGSGGRMMFAMIRINIRAALFVVLDIACNDPRWGIFPKWRVA